MQSLNKWNVSYSTIVFFENALASHSMVVDLKRTRDIVFTINLKNGNRISALLVNEYTLGLAAVCRAVSEFPEIEYIVTGGNWNGYTPEAKNYGRTHGIGIFNSSEFFGALNWADPKSYYSKDTKGNPVFAYRNP